MNPRAFLEVLALIVAAHLAAIIGGLLLMIPAPWFLDIPLWGLAGACYGVSAILLVLTGLGVRHLWREARRS